MNDEIIADSIRLIDADGEQVGLVPINQGLEMAEESGLDLVEVSLFVPTNVQAAR